MSRKPLALIATTLFAVLTAGTAFADKKSFFTSYARVTHVEPVYKYHTVYEPHKHCEYIRPHRQRHVTRNHNRQRVFISGNSYGQKNTQHQKRNHNQRVRNQHNRNNGNRGRQHCVTRTVSREVRRQDGFLVSYVYHGNHFQTRTNYHPGHQIRISVQIKPH